MIWLLVFYPCIYSSETVVFVLFTCWILWLVLHYIWDYKGSYEIKFFQVYNFAKIKERKEGWRRIEGERDRGNYGYLLRIVPEKYMKSVLLPLIKKFREPKRKLKHLQPADLQKSAKNIHCRQDSLFNKWCLQYWIPICRRFKLSLISHHLPKNELKGVHLPSSLRY